MKRSVLAVLALFAATGSAIADPTGKFDVKGLNPDTGGTYTGTVTIKRRGETYDVTWTIAGEKYYGTGIGALVRDGQFIAGPADKGDSSIAIGYVSGRTFGMAQYFLQVDGTWKGAWTYGGSGKVAIEEWRRK